MEPNNKRDEEIQQWIKSSGADIIGMAETNLCWHKARGGPFQERMKRWTISSEPSLTTNLHASIAYNKVEEWPNEYQIGGTAIITRGGLSCRIMNKGEDDEQMGRWCWTDYRGVRGIRLRVISAYRLVQTSNRGGTETVHAQQMRALDRLGRTEEPLKAFDTDFLNFIKGSRVEGYQLIIMMDANACIRTSAFTAKLKREGLTDHLSQKPENATINSFFRGSNIIDGIFISRTLTQQNGGYQSLDESPGDHRGIWIEVCAETALGSNNPIALPRQPRRLQIKIPSTVGKFNKVYGDHIKHHRLLQRAHRLRETASKPLTANQAQEYEFIDELMVIGMKKADKQCRKLRMGETQWTPTVTANNLTINALQLIIKKRKGGRVKTSLIKRKLKAANLPRATLTEPMNVIRQMEAEAHSNRREYKKDHIEHRNQWLKGQTSKMFDRGKGVIAGKLKAKRNRKQMRRTSKRIKIALQPFRPRGVTKVVIEGEEVTEHEGIIEGFKQEGIKRGSQTKETPLMVEPLLSEFGYSANNQNAERVLEGIYQPPEGTDEYAKKLLPHLKRPERVKTSEKIKSEISKDEYEQAWKVKKNILDQGLQDSTTDTSKRWQETPEI